ncbi:MAG: hypothetical protein B6D44_04285 [Ignavibacteriales bacterium UTCHB2]|jgi:hypothetical protein|nr:MAG: hypothetical protein B6D44_04285 [Ignavibacteriales bacterium UTCHB2]
MTYFWKEERGKPYYRFQTDEIEIKNKMNRREKFKLVGIGMNCPLWIYQATFSRPDIAKKAFETLIGCKSVFNSEEEIFVPMSKLITPEKSAA